MKEVYGCQGVAMPPDWNLAEIRATITPRNVKPANYEISLKLKVPGREITVFSTHEKLSLVQPVILVKYIPLKTDEMESIDMANISFNQIPASVPVSPVPTPLHNKDRRSSTRPS
jgi:hypothetical protein